jgi:hypothetical protein
MGDNARRLFGLNGIRTASWRVIPKRSPKFSDGQRHCRPANFALAKLTVIDEYRRHYVPCGADEIALRGRAKAAYRRFASQTLPIRRFVQELFGWSEIIASETAVDRELLFHRHRVVDPSAGTAGEYLAIAQNERARPQSFSYDTQSDISIR